jgi:hypothetical protein
MIIFLLFLFDILVSSFAYNKFLYMLYKLDLNYLEEMNYEIKLKRLTNSLFFVYDLVAIAS